MINRDTKKYPLLRYSETKDDYGQKKIQYDTECPETVKMAIYPIDRGLDDSVLYVGAQYLGLTFSKDIDDKCAVIFAEDVDNIVINGGDILKVIYVNYRPGRFYEVLMKKIGSYSGEGDWIYEQLNGRC